jgi:hypothetical protein
MSAPLHFLATSFPPLAVCRFISRGEYDQSVVDVMGHASMSLPSRMAHCLQTTSSYLSACMNEWHPDEWAAHPGFTPKEVLMGMLHPQMRLY